MVSDAGAEVRVVSGVDAATLVRPGDIVTGLLVSRLVSRLLNVSPRRAGAAVPLVT